MSSSCGRAVRPPLRLFVERCGLDARQALAGEEGGGGFESMETMVDLHFAPPFPLGTMQSARADRIVRLPYEATHDKEPSLQGMIRTCTPKA